MIKHFRNHLKDNNVVDPERVSEVMYNSIVNGVKQNEQVNENEDVDEDYRPLTDKQIKSIEDLNKNAKFITCPPPARSPRKLPEEFQRYQLASCGAYLLSVSQAIFSYA